MAKRNRSAVETAENRRAENGADPPVASYARPPLMHRPPSDRGALLIIIGVAAAAVLVVILAAIPGSRPVAEGAPLPDNEFTRLVGAVREIFAPTSHSLPVVLAKLLLAALLGGIIGYRQRLHVEEYIVQAHVIIAFTGALMMIIIGNEIVRAFGLLGAGSIVRYRTPVRDPKALASLFVTMAVGLAVGTGLYELAFVGAVLIVLLQGVMGTIVGMLPPTMYNPQRAYVLNIQCEDAGSVLARLKTTFAEHDIQYRLLEYDARGGKKEGLVKMSFKVEAGANLTTEQLTLLMLREGVQAVNWEEEGE